MAEAAKGDASVRAGSAACDRGNKLYKRRAHVERRVGWRWWWWWLHFNAGGDIFRAGVRNGGWGAAQRDADAGGGLKGTGRQGWG